MRRRITRVAMAVAAVTSLSTLEIIAAGPGAGAAARASAAEASAAEAGALSAGTLRPAAVPGAQLWASHFKGGAYRVAASPDGNPVFVYGTSQLGSTGADYTTVAYDAVTGARLWVKRYTGPGDDYAQSMAVSPDGTKVFVTGISEGTASTGYDYATVAYGAATGAQQWAKRYTSPGNGDDSAYSVAVSPSGGTVFVTGNAGTATTIAYSG